MLLDAGSSAVLNFTSYRAGIKFSSGTQLPSVNSSAPLDVLILTEPVPKQLNVTDTSIGFPDFASRGTTADPVPVFCANIIEDEFELRCLDWYLNKVSATADFSALAEEFDDTEVPVSLGPASDVQAVSPVANRIETVINWMFFWVLFIFPINQP